MDENSRSFKLISMALKTLNSDNCREEASCESNMQAADTDKTECRKTFNDVPNEDLSRANTTSDINTMCDQNMVHHEAEQHSVTENQLIAPEVESACNDGSEEESLDLPGSDDDRSYLPNEDAESNTTEDETPKRSRWRKANPENWKRNKGKRQRSQGLPYEINSVKRPAKSPKAVNCASCRYKCANKISEEKRREICKYFWNLTYERQKDFILKNVVQHIPYRRRTNTENGKPRNCSRSYYFITDSESVRVCQSFFRKTLNISDGPIIKAFSDVNDCGSYAGKDLRGKQPSVNKTSQWSVENVKEHIKKFPVVESHYCRQSSKRLYLDAKLSVTRMHDMYVEECKSSGVQPVSLITYRRSFSTNFNYSFFHPKKDQCLTCTKYERAQGNERDNFRLEYEAHIKRKNSATEAKQADKEKSECNDAFLMVTFDLQSVLQIPSDATSQLYYSRKLCVYNLTIYESKGDKRAYCYAWNEVNGKRGSCEIGTALFCWFKNVPETVKEVCLYSDTCSGQNRNQYIAALCMFLVKNSHLNVIEHKFLESGHSYMEVDSVHSAIESQKKNVPVYSMMDWLTIFRMARSSRKRKNAKPYIVKELTYKDMVNLTELSKTVIKNRNINESGHTVNWLKIKCLRYEKNNPNIIQYRYEHYGPYEQINTRGKLRGRGRPIEIPTQLLNLYTSPLPIAIEKKKDLEKLCATGVIPVELHPWYKSLPTSSSIRVTAPEPAVEDSEEEEKED